MDACLRGEFTYFLARSKLLFTKSLKGLMCSSLVNSTWLAMLCRICGKVKTVSQMIPSYTVQTV